ncbi:hypothetical protein MKX03_030807 [Papaver bracteatum]|nr:hypothetical protein MKX03_030807 [Papaver bracteatum]
MSARGVGDDNCDHRSQQEVMRLGQLQVESLGRLEALLKGLVESQTRIVESQENNQQQVLDILRSNNNYKNKVGQNPSSDQYKQQEERIASSSNTGKQGITEVPAVYDEQKKPPKIEVDDQVAILVDNEITDELFISVKTSDWERAEKVLTENPEAIELGITYDSSTILHLAIYHKAEVNFVKQIVELMPKKVLEYKTSENGFTALHMAARYGYTEGATIMLNKNPGLTQIRDNKGMIPLEVALRHVTIGQKKIVECLYSKTRDTEPSPFLGHDGARLLCSAIDANFYGMALSLVRRFPKLVMEKSLVHDMCGLELLVRRPFSFRSGAKLTWWQQCIYSSIHVDIDSTYERDEDSPSENSSEGTEGDAAVEESLLENSEDREVVEESLSENSEESSTSDTGAMAIYLMPYLKRVPQVKQLYIQKSMHKQANALLKQMLEELDNTTFGRFELLNFLNSNPNVIKAAIKHGVTEFIVECLEKFNFLIWYRIPEQSMIEMAIEERNEMIVNLICETCDDTGDDKIDLVSRTDDNSNTILHYAAKLAPSSQLNLISGAALQMQREVQWFKGVESIISENDKFKRNYKGDTAQLIFSEKHKDLLKKSEDWMKDTSGSCMIVGALIATVAFAAAFTVPGGNVSDSSSSTKKNGTPIFLGDVSFSVFAIADALALFSSITSVLMFLAIYTSRYAERDFLKSLPQKLIIGLATLFISMAAILIAFGASLYIVVGTRYAWASVPIVLFGCCPVALFAWLQLPLFLEMVRSTYWGVLFQKHRYIDPSFEENDNEKKENIMVRVKKQIRSFWL